MNVLQMHATAFGYFFKKLAQFQATGFTGIHGWHFKLLAGSFFLHVVGYRVLWAACHGRQLVFQCSNLLGLLVQDMLLSCSDLNQTVQFTINAVPAGFGDQET